MALLKSQRYDIMLIVGEVKHEDYQEVFKYFSRLNSITNLLGYPIVLLYTKIEKNQVIESHFVKF